jgi:hypothetical protein
LNKYTFNWKLVPSMAVEYTISVPPFEAVARDNVLTLSVSGVAADEPNLLQQADQIARDLVRCFSYRLRKRFDIVYGGYQRQSPDRIDGFAAVVGARAFCLAGTVDVEVRDRAGNVVDSSAMRRERDQQATQHGLSDLTKRAARDANLRDMLDHWGRYVADPDGRLHPLYDVLQVAERLYKGREKAAAALNLVYDDVDNLGKISNNPTVLNSRHPGKAPGPHRIATEAEVETCERAAQAIIENYAKTIVI